MSGHPAVVFDLDGTLLDSASPIAIALNQIIADRGGSPVAVERVRGFVSHGARAMVRACLGTLATTPEADLAAFRAIYDAQTPDPADLYPGAADLISGLRAEGYRLGLCTNKPQSLTERILKGLNLFDAFEAVVGGDRCSRPKPAPEHVLTTLAQMGARPAEAAYVGDSEVDAEAAMAAGLPFFLVTFGYAMGRIEDIACRARLDRLGDLPAALQKMVKAG